MSTKMMVVINTVMMIVVSLCVVQGGPWHLLQESIGISAMHMQLLKNNKVVIFDRTDFGPSNLSLPGGRCRFDPKDTALQTDCTAHSILYDVGANIFTALTVQTDTWCSSGAVLPDGTLVQTGGFNDGDHAVRTLAPCEAAAGCDWVEFPRALSQRRWYASNQLLPDGRVIIVGGRQQFNYEYYPAAAAGGGQMGFDFLRETKDERYENNLYPFLHLLPDGNLFVFANTRSIVFDHSRNRVVRQLPPIPGDGPRNYPSSGSSVLLPIDENAIEPNPEVMICGGAAQDAFQLASRGTFLRATSTCGRLKIITGRRPPSWEMEEMPMARVMGDMLLLPDGAVIIINGARSGSAGWESARDPVTSPVIYNPDKNRGFQVMAASPRPRLYHSTAVLLTDGRVLVGGSNPHKYYNFTGVDYPTDLSLESFAPPYLAPQHDPLRPTITGVDETLIAYKTSFSFTFRVSRLFGGAVSVRIVAPSFNTHSSSMNQRMVVLKVAHLNSCVGAVDHYRVSAYAPSTPQIAPPGYYVLFVVHSGIPSSGNWLLIQ